MKKTLFLTLLLSIAFGLLLYSCRTEDEAVVSENRNNTESASFQVFKDHSSQYARRGGSMFYQEGFRDLYLSYYKDHPEEAPDADSSDFHIDFRRASQVLYGADSTRYVLFPFMKGNEVKYVVACSVNNNHDYVSFYFPERNKMVDNAITAFSLASRSNAMSRGERCGFEGEPPCEIEEITINGPTNEVTPTLSPGTPYGFDPDYQFPPSGGCGPYNNCGGGGGTPYQPTPITPCQRLKDQNANTDYQAKIESLDKNSVLSQKKETGYSENKSGTFTDLEQSESTDASDGLQVPDSPDTKGYIHTHLNDYETGNTDANGNPEIKSPIRMFSPADVNTLMVLAGHITNGDYSHLYGTMVSSYGNYTIKFTGTAADIKTGFKGETWRKKYAKYIEKENGTLEAKFLRFLKDEMNVQGIELYKIKSNGTIKKKSLNSNNNVQSDDCPQ